MYGRAVNGLSAFNWNDLIKRSDENKNVRQCSRHIEQDQLFNKLNFVTFWWCLRTAKSGDWVRFHTRLLVNLEIADGFQWKL